VNRARRIERLEAVLLTDDSRDAAGPPARERLTAEIARLASPMAGSEAPALLSSERRQEVSST